MGGKPDALIAGTNVEVSNKLTLQRRPGLLPYGVTSIQPPLAFFDWGLATTNDLILIADTGVGGVNNAGQVIRYSPTYAGVYVDKGLGAAQTNFFDVVNTLYLGNGIDRYKIVGPNLLTQSNTFGMGSGTNFSIQSPWTDGDIFALTGGQTDPLGTSTATQIIWSTTGAGAFLQQTVTPNYTPVNNNTFTFSLWMKRTGGANTVSLEISDISGVVVNTAFALTTQWAKYQVTGTMGAGISGLNHITVTLHSPTTTNTMVIYGAQLEVGGPATTTQVTTTKPQGVWLWGIQGPATAPTFTFSNQVGNTGQPWQSNHNYTVGQTIVDSNGNIQYVLVAGESGSAEPVWSEQQTTVAAATAQLAAEEVITGSTVDGAQNSVIQANSSFVSASTLSLPFTAAVTASNTLLAFVFGDVATTPASLSVTDTQGNTWTKIAQSISGNFQSALYTVRSAAGGPTTVTATFSGPSSTSVWLALAEVNGLTGIDVFNTNSARDYLGTIFNTGVVTTTHAQDMLISFAVFGNNTGAGSEIGSPPTGFSQIASQTGVQGRSSGHFLNMAAVFEFLSTITVINPSWNVANPAASNGITGITAAFSTSIGTLLWIDLGPVGAGLSPTIGYQYYYAFMNSYTGHVSNVSPISVSTGVQAGQIISVFGVGMQITPSGPYSQDPQVDMIAVFRNTDGGGFWYQIAQFPNPGTTSSAGTWELNDIAPDNGETVTTTIELNGTPSTITEALNTSIFAPIALLNSIPPAGIVAMEYFEGRMWGSVLNLLYFNTAADNAQLLGIQQNGVPSESWGPANVTPFNAPITRSVALGGGLTVCTVDDIWLVSGINLVNGGWATQKAFANHGLRSYNALTIDGSTIWKYTSDRQCLMINPNSGSVEVGFPIGDLLQSTFNPADVYMARHVDGSEDNAVFMSDGSTGWYRLNPNQQGASMSGEQTPVWSPKADFTASIGGIGAIASIETTPGVTQLIVGQTVYGPVLVRDLNTFSDNGTGYDWSATIGSILLATPGKLAETESVTTEMNNTASAATQCTVGVLLEEIAGAFEVLPLDVDDPPQLAPSVSVLSNRFYLSQGTDPPVCRHLQIQLSGGTQITRDEILAVTVRGALVAEQV